MTSGIGNPLRVVCIDDSPTARRILLRALSVDPDIEVVAEAANAIEGRNAVVRLRPDVVLLDINMPGMDGLTFLERLMRFLPMPVIVISSLTRSNSEAALQALQLGAVDVLGKPSGPSDMAEFSEALVRAVHASAMVDVQKLLLRPRAVPRRLMPRFASMNQRAVAIGASTGGPQALERVLSAMPADAPGVLVVQHMPAGFIGQFAQRLDGLCAIRVKPADDGDVVVPGTALIAGKDCHLRIVRTPDHWMARLAKDPPISGHRPSVDVLFRSMALELGTSAIGVLLTGMGADGADGLVEMRQSGARTIAQDEQSSVIFGMPKEGALRGGAEFVLPLDEITGQILDLASAPLIGSKG